eukprot:UN14177
MWEEGRSLADIMKNYGIKRTRRNSDLIKQMIATGVERTNAQSDNSSDDALEQRDTNVIKLGNVT